MAEVRDDPDDQLVDACVASRLSLGRLRTWKIPACLASTRNTVFSFRVAVVVTLRTTSK